MGVDLAHELHLRQGGDPKEPVPAPQPRTDPGDAREQRVPPVSRRELPDPLHRVALGVLREEHFDGPGLRIYSQPESEEVAVLRASDGRLGLIHPQTQAPLDELGKAGHHPLPRPLATHVHLGVVCIANEPVATPVKLTIELVQHDVRQQRRERTALRNALLRVDHNTVRQHHLGLQHPSDQHEQPPIADSLCELGGQPLVADEIEELLQIKIYHPLVAVLEMRLGLGDRRVATSAGSEPVVRGMERRLPQRLEHLPHGLLNHPVDHVRNPQPPPPALGMYARRISPGRYIPSSRSACSRGSTTGHCSHSTSIVCPSGPGAPLFDATFNNASVNRYATSSIVADAAVPVLPIAFGAPARISPSRTRDLLRVAPVGFSAVTIDRQSCTAVSSTGTAFPCPPGPHPTRSTGLSPPSGNSPSSDFCRALRRRPLLLRPTSRTRLEPSRSPGVKR